MTKKIGALLLSVVMAFSLASCGDTKTSSTASKTASSIEQTEDTSNNNSDENNSSENNISHNSNPAVTEPVKEEFSFDNQKLAKVVVEGSNFVVNDEILFFNAVNTPWDKWNDVGGSFNEVFWRTHFAKLHEEGVNATRIWISCNGAMIDIDDNGHVNGPKDKFWTDMDTLLKIADENEIYIMATLMSFDNFKDEGQPFMSWRKLFDSEENMNSMVDNYVIPFCEKFDSYNALWSIDLCNEPDWIHENDECGKFSFDKICALFAREAAAIHENSDILVTIGFGIIKYNSDKYEGNFGSASYLQGLYDNELAYMDFNSTHFYEWEAPWFGFPFDTDPATFGLDTKIPSVIGEFPATGMTDKTKGSKNMSGSECYVSVYNNGWNGIMAWTSNGVDTCGKLDDFVDGVREVAELMKASN